MTATSTQRRPPEPLRQRLRELHLLMHETVQALYAQRELLAQREIDLPLEPLQALERLSQDLFTFSQSASDSSLELQQLRHLARITQIINSTLSLDQVLNDVIDTVVSLTNAQRGFIVLQDPHSQEFVLSVARKIAQDDLDKEAMRLSRTAVQRVIQSGEPLLVTDAQSDPRFTESESVLDLSLRSLLCVPLKHKTRTIG
ncbi:MAG: GAF domain-containing protein, partial [Aggregatilineales bacterium]